MFEFLLVVFRQVLEGYVAAAKASAFWSQIILLVFLLISWRLLKSALAIEDPAKRVLRLNILWDAFWSVFALLGILQWIIFTPDSQGKLLLLFIGLPLMAVIGFPLYFMTVHGVYVLGLYIWTRWKHPEMTPRTGRYLGVFALIAVAAFGVVFLTRWLVSARLPR